MYIDLSAVSYKNELHSTVSPLPPPFFTAMLSLSLSAGEENFTLLVKSHKSHDFGQILHQKSHFSVGNFVANPLIQV